MQPLVMSPLPEGEMPDGRWPCCVTSTQYSVLSTQCFPTPDVTPLPLEIPVTTRTLPAFERTLEVSVRSLPLLTRAPWARALGKLTMEVSTQGWRFPTPSEFQSTSQPANARPEAPREPDASPNAPAKP